MSENFEVKENPSGRRYTEQFLAKLRILSKGLKNFSIQRINPLSDLYMCVGCGCSLLLDICIFLMFEGPKED